MNILNGTKCYLAGNLQNEDFGWAKSWRNEFKTLVSEFGIKTLSPLDEVFLNFKKEGEAFQFKIIDHIKNGRLEVAHELMQNIRRKDLAMIDHSNFVVCVLDVEKPTYGTIEELSLAQKSNKPVFLTIKQGLDKIPLWILGMFKPSYFYQDINHIFEMLKLIDSGKVNITTENWRIFKQEYL